MSSEKTTAIVLRVVDFSETSCVVTLFTRDFGKIGALAKGARRPKSPFESALDLLAVCRIVFLHKSSDALDLLTEAKLERRFRAATRDLSRLYAGYYVAELLREMTQEGDPHRELYEHADRMLLDLEESGADVFGLVLRFELTTLRLLGHLPALTGCASCGAELEMAGRLFFGQRAGGLLCAPCRAGQRDVASVTAKTVKILQHFASSCVVPGCGVEVGASEKGEIRGLINRYLWGLLDRRLRMHEFLGVLAGASDERRDR